MVHQSWTTLHILKKSLKENIHFFFTWFLFFLELKMPVLVIVAEGDLASIELVKKVLEQSIPVLVLKGSGKAADLIAEGLDKDK